MNIEIITKEEIDALFEKKPKFDLQFIYQHITNAVEEKEYLYWVDLANQAEDYGIEFAEETYKEDLAMCGGELKWD